MPWQETWAMTERMRFILAVQAGAEPMAVVCRRFGISRKTGDKWRRRFDATGATGLADRSRAPHTCPHAVPPAVRPALGTLRGQHPTRGPKKLAIRLPQVYPGLVAPAASTIGDLLKTAGLVVPRRVRRRAPPRTAPLAPATAPHTVWCADFKGECLLGDGPRCYPLTSSAAPPLPAALPGAAHDRDRARPAAVRGELAGVWAARCDPHRQRAAVCLDRGGRTDPLEPVVAAAGHLAGPP